MKLLFKPSEFDFIAVSGGMDSMVLADFVLRGGHTKPIVHFNHGTEFGDKAQRFVFNYASVNDFTLFAGTINSPKPKDESWEEYWRNQRYGFFKSLNGKIALAHHLDDAIETYLFYCLNGKKWSMPKSNGNVVRPFLATPKSEIESWAKRKNVDYLDDPSNCDRKYARSIIRHDIMPKALEVNPGLGTVVKKLIN